MEDHSSSSASWLIGVYHSGRGPNGFNLQEETHTSHGYLPLFAAVNDTAYWWSTNSSSSRSSRFATSTQHCVAQSVSQSRICAQAIQTFITMPCSAMFTKLFAIVFAAPHWLGTYCLSSFGKGVRGMGPGRDHAYNHAMVECAHAQPQSVLSSSITSY